MKKTVLFLSLLIASLLHAQIQIGANINGEIEGDLSGSNVSLSADGNILAIGAPHNDGNGDTAGHVRVYQNIAGTWTQIGADIDGEAADDRSGTSISLSANGNVLAIGAPFNDGNGGNSGHVRIYQNTGNTWTQIGGDIDGKTEGDRSGWSVSLSADGTIVAIGAIENSANGLDSGHVRVFQNNGGNWMQIGTDINGETADELSGSSISLSADGNTVAIGSTNSDNDLNIFNGERFGQVRIYENIGGTWTQIGTDIHGEAADDRSGSSVDLSADGTIVAIGAPRNGGNGDEAGHVRIYQNVGGTWTQIGQDIDGEATGDRSGISVSLSSDGSIVAIGSANNNGIGANAGHVRIYQNINGTWTQIGTDIDGENQFDKSGSSINLSADGNIVAIGAPYNAENGQWSGHVRVFDISNEVLNITSEELENSKIYTAYNSLYIAGIQEGNVNLKVYNILGNLVLDASFKANGNNSITLPNLNAGIYIVHLKTEKGHVSKKILIE